MYLRPNTVEDALQALASAPWTILAGGTDFYPARVGRTVREAILDISALAGLRGIAETDQGWRIGALTTWSDVLAQPLPACFDGLKRAAREVGGRQIQNAGTVLGNLCNASAAADGVPPLLALQAEIELTSMSGVRRLALEQFLCGNRQTLRKPAELATAVLLPSWQQDTRSTFVKLGARHYMVISIAMVAANVELDRSGVIKRCGVAVGACSPVAQRLISLERKLAGRRLSSELADLPARQDLMALQPLSDVRGSASYRRDAVLTLLRRALTELAGE